MNKNRRTLHSQARKKNNKEIKKGQKLIVPEETLRTDTLTPAKALKKYPAKESQVESMVKNMEIKKKKLQSNRSKRTTPDEVDFHESPPAHIHIEGFRWEKTRVKQSVGNGKALTAKILKRAVRAQVHTEGVHLEKTGVKQSAGKGKTLTTKTQKKAARTQVIQNEGVRRGKTGVKQPVGKVKSLTAKTQKKAARTQVIQNEGVRRGKTDVKQSVGKRKTLTTKIQKKASRAPKGKK